MRGALLVALVATAGVAFADDAALRKLARRRWPDANTHPFAYTTEKADHVSDCGANKLLLSSVSAVASDLSEFDRIDHVAIVRFLLLAETGRLEIAYECKQGQWELERHGNTMTMETEEALEYSAPLVPGWNVVEFRVGMDNTSTLQRSITVKLNDQVVGRNRLSFNGRLENIRVSTHGASAVVANGGVEIGPTRVMDAKRVRR